MKLDLMKGMLDPIPMPPRQPRLELSLHEANLVHKTLIKAHQQARRASETAYQAYREAQQATIEAYAALSGFESELLHFEEKHQLSPMQKFKFVTIENPEEGGEGA